VKKWPRKFKRKKDFQFWKHFVHKGMLHFLDQCLLFYMIYFEKKDPLQQGHLSDLGRQKPVFWKKAHINTFSNIVKKISKSFSPPKMLEFWYLLKKYQTYWCLLNTSWPNTHYSASTYCTCTVQCRHCIYRTWVFSMTWAYIGPELTDLSFDAAWLYYCICSTWAIKKPGPIIYRTRVYVELGGLVWVERALWRAYAL
jgi:hypothetical protein